MKLSLWFNIEFDFTRRATACKKRLQISVKLLRHFRMTQRELNGRLQITELAAAIETLAFVSIRQHLFVSEQRLDGIGQLDLAARARLLGAQMLKYPRHQNVSSDHAEIRRRERRFRFFNHARDLKQMLVPLAAIDHTIRS